MDQACRRKGTTGRDGSPGQQPEGSRRLAGRYRRGNAPRLAGASQAVHDSGPRNRASGRSLTADRSKVSRCPAPVAGEHPLRPGWHGHGTAVHPFISLPHHIPRSSSARAARLYGHPAQRHFLRQALFLAHTRRTADLAASLSQPTYRPSRTRMASSVVWSSSGECEAKFSDPTCGAWLRQLWSEAVGRPWAGLALAYRLGLGTGNGGCRADYHLRWGVGLSQGTRSP